MSPFSRTKPFALHDNRRACKGDVDGVCEDWLVTGNDVGDVDDDDDDVEENDEEVDDDDDDDDAPPSLGVVGNVDCFEKRVAEEELVLALVVGVTFTKH